MSINLSYINTKHTLQVEKHKIDLCTAIVQKVEEIDKYKTLKFDNELLIFVCNCIENALDVKVDKKTLALQIYEKLFDELSQDDAAILSSSIDFLCNNKLVKKMPRVKKYASILFHWGRSKL
jgi:hypothetical protein